MPFILQSHEIHNLDTYTQYLVSLQVFNPEGPGPSTTVLVMTDEGGELCIKIIRKTPFSVIYNNIHFAKRMSHIIILVCPPFYNKPNTPICKRVRVPVYVDLPLPTYSKLTHCTILIRSIKAKIKCFVSQQC